MTVHPPTVYRWQPGMWVPPIPGDPDPGPGYEPPVVPDQPGAQGDEWLVGVVAFAPHGENVFRGILWGAVIENMTICVRELGPQRIEIRVPLTEWNLRVWGSPSGEFDQQGQPLYHVRGSVARELVVGSALSGRPRWRFFTRGEVRIEGGFMRIGAVGIVGGLTSDRVLGSVRGPVNKLHNASWESGTLAGWYENGVEAQVSAGGIDGGTCVRVRGVPNGSNSLRQSVRWKVGAAQLEFGRLAAGVYVRLPDIGPEIDSYGLLTVTTFDWATGTQIWPFPGRGHLAPGVVGPDMPRGDWANDQVTAEGGTGMSPFDVRIQVDLYPTSATEWTYFDGALLANLEFLRTFSAWDRSVAISQMMRLAQVGRDKSPWGVGVITRGNIGSYPDHRQWSLDENPSLDELIEQVVSYEPPGEVWDDATIGRNIAVGPRRGAVRNDLRVQPWDVLGKVQWSVDPGAQRTSVRGLNTLGASALGSIDVGAIDTSKAGGQVIDVLMQGPRDMRQRELRAWTRRQLERLSVLQGSMTLLLTWRTGMRLAVGDTVRVAVADGRAVHVDWMRVMSWTPDLQGQSGVLVQFGTDVDLGGR